MTNKKIDISLMSLNNAREKKPKRVKEKKNFGEKNKRAREIRKNLIGKLKNRTNDVTPTNEQNKAATFDDTMDFLSGIIEKKKKRRDKKKTRSQRAPEPIQIKEKIKNNNNNNNIIVNTEASHNTIKIKADPPFGVLKGGRKKTYRQYYNIKNPITIREDPQQGGGSPKQPESISSESPQVKTSPPPTPHQPTSQPKPTIHRTEKLKELKNTVGLKNRNYTIKKRFHIGFKNNNVNMLIKNKTMKNKYKELVSDIEAASTKDKKKYLLRRNLIDKYSNVPDNVIEQLYSDSVLAGDITNAENNLDITIE